MSTRMSKNILLLLLVVLVLLQLISTLSTSPSQQFEGFDLDDDDDELDTEPELHPIQSPSISISTSTSTQSPPSPVSQSPPSPVSNHHLSDNNYWDEDEFEGLPVVVLQTQQQQQQQQQQPPKDDDDVIINATSSPGSQSQTLIEPMTFNSIVSKYAIEIVCVTFLVIFAVNYFTGKKENENLALAWAARFATKDSIFDKNFSLLGVGEGEDSPLLLKEGQNVFKFYASGRRYCQGLLGTMDLKSRHDLISRVYNGVVVTKDEISFEVFMNDESMDQVVFAVARRKLAKAMLKDFADLNRFAALMPVPTGRKWLTDHLTVVTESKEVAADFINDVVLDQVFGEKAFEKIGKYFISMHFSDQQSGPHKKKLMFKFALPDIKNMADMTRLVALVPYYIDFVGRYKLSSQARSKTDGARVKVAQEVYKELQNARQEALQRKKADKKKMMEEAEAKLSVEAIRKKEAKERARQTKKGMPKMKMTRA